MKSMGRHARGVARSRVPLATGVLGILIVAVIAGGSWLGSKAQPASAASSLTTGPAVVLSSLACTDGGGGTLVDVRGPMGGSAARATLDGCGYQVGQELMVQYPVDDPTQVALAGTTTADAGLEQSPLGIIVAGLLALAGAAAVWFARRRTPGGDGVVLTPPAAVGDGSDHLVGGRHARLDAVDTDPAADSAPSRAASSVATEHVGSGPVQLPTVDLVFPFASSLAASLRDELFTHRSLPT